MKPQIIKLLRSLLSAMLLLLSLIALSSLSACGKKGGLYLPAPVESEESSNFQPAQHPATQLTSQTGEQELNQPQRVDVGIIEVQEQI